MVEALTIRLLWTTRIFALTNARVGKLSCVVSIALVIVDLCSAFSYRFLIYIAYDSMNRVQSQTMHDQTK